MKKKIKSLEIINDVLDNARPYEPKRNERITTYEF